MGEEKNEIIVQVPDSVLDQADGGAVDLGPWGWVILAGCIVALVLFYIWGVKRVRGK